MTNKATNFIKHKSKYVELSGKSLCSYQWWVDGEVEIDQNFSKDVTIAAKLLLNDKDQSIVVSAIQAIACAGLVEDSAILKGVEPLKESNIAVEYLLNRFKSVEEFLSEVHDYQSFRAFAVALADERDKAAKIERANPNDYRLDGALNWKNANVGSFISSGLVYLDEENRERNGDPSWQDFAHFLYMGKIWE